MKKSILKFAVFVLMSVSIPFQAVSGSVDLKEFFINSWPRSIVNTVREFFIPPENSNQSIQYLLYTRSNPKEPCFIEPTPEEFDRCPFDPTLETKILIHGWIVTRQNDNSFELIKDELLKHDSYNVIYVDWSRYNGHPYRQARSNTIPVGRKIAEFINFIKSYTGSEAFHLIGHSLGAHISGIAGENVGNIKRITGLDPAGQFYELNETKYQLDYTDADFVDVIHSSYYDYDQIVPYHGKGRGKLEPIGHMDFYPNGGRVQNAACENSSMPNATRSASALFDDIICNHFMANIYFLHSISDCEYVSTKCKDYKSLPVCASQGTATAKMGFYAKPIQGLPVKSVFYLKTSGREPYC